MRKFLLIMAFVCMASIACAAGAIITQSQQRFDVEEVTIKAGDTLTFTNKDDVTHNIQVIDAEGDVEDKGLQKPGTNVLATFPKAGEYNIRCAIHPKMKLTVTVK